MGFIRHSLALTLMIFVSARINASEQEVKAIVGVDNRYQVQDPTTKPHSMVGSLTYTHAGRIGKCTASLVGPDLILTNSHCVVTKGTQKSYQHSNFMFRPQYQTAFSTPEIPAVLVEWGTNNPGQQRSVDWALLRLSIPVGNIFGYFSVSSMRADRVNSLIGKTISTTGYPGDKQNGNQMWAHSGCKFTAVRGDRYTNNYGYLKHNCDTYVGASGSPLYAAKGGKYVLYGLHSAGISGVAAENNLEDHNGAVQPQEIFDAVKRHNLKPSLTEVEIEGCSNLNPDSALDGLAADMKKVEKQIVGEYPSAFIICNQSDKTYQVASAFEEVIPASGETKAAIEWVSVGLTKIPPKKCSNFFASTLKSSDTYIYVTDYGGGEKSFCIKPEGEFKINKSDGKCPEGAVSTPFTQRINLVNEQPQIFNLN